MYVYIYIYVYIYYIYIYIYMTLGLRVAGAHLAAGAGVREGDAAGDRDGAPLHPGYEPPQRVCECVSVRDRVCESVCVCVCVWERV